MPPVPGKTIWITALLIAVHLCCLAGPAPSSSIDALYLKANRLFNLPHPTAATDSMALAIFGEIIAEAGSQGGQGAQGGSADMVFQCWLKEGVLLDVKGRYREALDAYTGAQHCLSKHPDWSDSLYFKLYIYAGPDYYQLDQFDSAYSVLGKAEELAARFHGLREKDRLYNALGALYYEGGNYLQARDYFTRALEIIRQERPNDKASAINFNNNIASCLYKLGAYRESIGLYTQLIGQGIFSSQLYLNVGKSYIELNDYAKAMLNFRRVLPQEVPGVFNEMAYTQFLMGKYDSAMILLDQWSRKTAPSMQTKLDAGVNHLYRAQVEIAKGRQMEAMKSLQQAIVSFSGVFKDPDIHANPVDFTGSFATYRLFDAITYKAKAWEMLYRQLPREEYLLGAWQAYNSAILLFRHIERTYTTDDAKLFLKKNNADLYHRALMVCLELDRLHPGGDYLEKAFQVAEKSKASILSANLDMAGSGSIPGVDPRLLERQRAIKYDIARLELRGDAQAGGNVGGGAQPGGGEAQPGGGEAQPGGGSAPLGGKNARAIADQKADDEIELSDIQKSLEMNSAYYKMKFEDAGFTLKELRGRLNEQQAIVSLFVAPEGLHVFTLTTSSFHHLLIDSPDVVTKEVKAWIAMLDNTVPGRRFGDKALETSLNRRLVQPLLSVLSGKDEWIIIPDQIFNLLSFESLPGDKDGTPLIETKTISYQLSAKFLGSSSPNQKTSYHQYAVLSFAPFAGSGEWVNTQPSRYVERLPSSGQEIAGLQGKQFLNAQATKDRFLQEMNHFPVIHLATHALTDPQDSQVSMICFFPQHGGGGEDCLFLPELYGLNMDSTDLVILSACESGKGSIVDNEGMISLSRGFLYAGCASTVNSLWKADDRSTELILQKFHFYLERGYSKPAALRQAKLDYIHGNDVYTSPNYWAHLILVGNTGPVMLEERDSNVKWWLIVGMLGLIPILINLVKAVRKSASLNL
jgi:CHAT domain-containing protein